MSRFFVYNGVMRLFIAFTPDKQSVRALRRYQNEWKEAGMTGRFVAGANLHMTALFIGEVSEKQAETIGRIAAALPFSPMTLPVSGAGHFRKLWYVKVEETEKIRRHVMDLRDRLQAASIPFDSKPFFAHITMVRNADGAADRLPVPARIRFESLTLYESAYRDGKLTYIPLK